MKLNAPDRSILLKRTRPMRAISVVLLWAVYYSIVWIPRQKECDDRVHHVFLVDIGSLGGRVWCSLGCIKSKEGWFDVFTIFGAGNVIFAASCHGQLNRWNTDGPTDRQASGQAEWQRERVKFSQLSSKERLSSSEAQPLDLELASVSNKAMAIPPQFVRIDSERLSSVENSARRRGYRHPVLHRKVGS